MNDWKYWKILWTKNEMKKMKITKNSSAILRRKFSLWHVHTPTHIRPQRRACAGFPILYFRARAARRRLWGNKCRTISPSCGHCWTSSCQRSSTVSRHSTTGLTRWGAQGQAPKAKKKRKKRISSIDESENHMHTWCLLWPPSPTPARARALLSLFLT